MRLVLVSALVFVIASITLSSLLAIRHRIQQQVLDAFRGDLTHSVEAFRDLEAQQLEALQRENALLADLPSLKALMTTDDRRTIADAAVQFWKVSGNDLFALASNDGTVLVAFARDSPTSSQRDKDLTGSLIQTNRRFFLSNGHLYEYSVQPVYFGSETNGTLLGYVISGYAIDADFLKRVTRSFAAEVTFLGAEGVLTSTLPDLMRREVAKQAKRTAPAYGATVTRTLNGQRFLTTAVDLSSSASAPLRLIVMKSFRNAEQAQREINNLLLLVGLLAVITGTALMLTIAAAVTRSLESLAGQVQTFGQVASRVPLPVRGPREVRQLSIAFSNLQEEVKQKSRALIEAERLATIGRMASSISHDLRHYLAAVYANAEFLASSRLTEEERSELFAEIRVAVNGTTELIESLLTFSRGSGTLPRVPEAAFALLDRALSLVRTHPDAGEVRWHAPSREAGATLVVVDPKQIERAIFNLLLNACQAARKSTEPGMVHVDIFASDDVLTIRVSDNGPGVSESIRGSLFEPFVSEGKQNGTGLGLTLAQRIAQEHGGSVDLVSTRRGETTFALRIACGVLPYPSEQEIPTEVSS